MEYKTSEKTREAKARYRLKNREKIREISKLYYYKNIDKSRERSLERDKRLYSTQKEAMNNHKIAIGCSICGYNKCGAALDWHHIGNNKERRITVRSYFTPLNIKEREKCILVCANCHREIHHNEKEMKDIKEKENEKFHSKSEMKRVTTMKKEPIQDVYNQNNDPI